MSSDEASKKVNIVTLREEIRDIFSNLKYVNELFK